MGYTESSKDALGKPWLAVFALTASLIASATATAQQQELNSLQGTWVMESVYEQSTPTPPGLVVASRLGLLWLRHLIIRTH